MPLKRKASRFDAIEALLDQLQKVAKRFKMPFNRKEAKKAIIQILKSP